MILPARLACIAGITARAMKNGASRLVAIRRRQSASLKSTIGAAVLDAGVVDEDVDGAERALDRGDAAAHRVGVGDVERRDLDREALAAQQRRRRVELGARPAVEDDARTRRGEAARDRQAEARSARP